MTHDIILAPTHTLCTLNLHQHFRLRRAKDKHDLINRQTFVIAGGPVNVHNVDTNKFRSLIVKKSIKIQLSLHLLCSIIAIAGGLLHVYTALPSTSGGGSPTDNMDENDDGRKLDRIFIP